MNKQRIADLTKEWNEVIEQLDYDDFHNWFSCLQEEDQVTAAKMLMTIIIHLCRSHGAAAKRENRKHANITGGIKMNEARKKELDQQWTALSRMDESIYNLWFDGLTETEQAYILEAYGKAQNSSQMNDTLRVLIVEPGKCPYEKTISSGLESLQREVGGNIEVIYPFADPVAIILDEEGKLKGKPWNRVLRDEDGAIYDFLSGTFLVVGLGDENFISLTPELMEQFSRIYHTPERFLDLGGATIVLPMEPKEQEGSVYPHTARYAAEHGELAQYQESARQNLACTKAIEQAIQDNYLDHHLDPAGAKEVLKQFGKERVQFILALTIQHKQEDGRISPDNKKWAGIMNMPEGSELYQDTAQFAVNQAHPGLLDLFTTQTRSLIAQKERSPKKQSQRDR